MDSAVILKSSREKAGLSVRGLSKLTDISPSTIHRIEKGELNPTVDTLDELLSATGLSLKLGEPDYGKNVFGLVQSIIDDKDIERNDTEWIVRKTAYFVSQALKRPELTVYRYLLIAPPSTGSGNWDAFIAGVVEWIMHQKGIEPYDYWVYEPKYFLGHGWWIGGYDSLAAIEWAGTPGSLKQRGVYIHRDSLINL